MHSIIKGFFVCLALMLFAGCGSKVYYKVKPTPLEQGKSTYIIDKLELRLDESTKDITNLTYLNQEQLSESFKEKITNQLKEQGIFGDEYLINIDIDYVRVFNMGGNKLNKPNFKYSIEILNKSGELIASYGIPVSTTKYSYFKDIAVFTEIATFNRDAEDEPEDIELISKTIVEEIKNIGK
ncbi:MAG: hypothetical protein LBS39_02915 [Campylobacteraceae bacterium]|jgi:hypothetical protein|nr:hypothetical protein [Campylobacteraceae bacterium]